jgi:hypothetical protein
MAELTRKQGEAIAALLSVPTITEAARHAGVGGRTLYRWLQEDATFQQAYRDARRAAVSQAIAHVQRATSTAVKTLEAIMRSTKAPSSARVSAARAVLEMALKGMELEDLSVRIEALERALHGRNGHGWT